MKLEPGLRKIPKDTSDFTSQESSPAGSSANYEEEFEHIYATIDDPDETEENIYEECFGGREEGGEADADDTNEEESGFFSYLSQQQPCYDGHITTIPVNQPTDSLHSSPNSSLTIRVGGREFLKDIARDSTMTKIQPENLTSTSTTARVHLKPRIQTVVPIRVQQYERLRPDTLSSEHTVDSLAAL